MSVGHDNPGVIAKPPTIYLIAMVIGLALQWVLPLPIMRLAARLWIGIAIIVMGLLVMVAAVKEFRKLQTPEDTNLPTTTLVISGPYRHSRNPMYISLTLLLSGIGLALNSWWVLLMLVPVMIIMQAGVISREERYLEQKFGQAYRQYKTSVRRWL
jgi:protein-S-isoprenylcysteine O-methyltransferase Ste14